MTSSNDTSTTSSASSELAEHEPAGKPQPDFNFLIEDTEEDLEEANKSFLADFAATVELSEDMPQLLQEVLLVWDFMKKTSTQTKEGLIYRGALSTELHTAGIVPRTKYAHVVGKLRAMGCIRQMRRGGGPQPSLWLLMVTPTEDLYYSTAHKPDTRSGSRGPAAVVIRELDRRTKDLETRVTKLTTALATMQTQVEELHRAVFPSAD